MFIVITKLFFTKRTRNVNDIKAIIGVGQIGIVPKFINPL